MAREHVSFLSGRHPEVGFLDHVIRSLLSSLPNSFPEWLYYFATVRSSPMFLYKLLSFFFCGHGRLLSTVESETCSSVISSSGEPSQHITRILESDFTVVCQYMPLDRRQLVLKRLQVSVTGVVPSSPGPSLDTAVAIFSSVRSSGRTWGSLVLRPRFSSEQRSVHNVLPDFVLY